MHPFLSPQEKSQLFRFSEKDCLYRDHHGDRVLADLEGRGYFAILQRPEDLACHVDDNRFNRFEGTYDHSLLVTCRSDAPATVVAYSGRDNPVQGPFENGSKFTGSGWIFRCDGPCRVDGEERDRFVVDLQFPVPYFRFAEGAGLEVVRSSVQYKVADSFAVGDAEALRARDWQVKNVSALFELSSSFSSGLPLTALVFSHLNAASWWVELPSGCRDLVLRKLYDRFHGRQRARVLVDGELMGWWYEPDQDRDHRWAWAQFGIEERFVAGKERVRITVDPPAGSPLWSVSRVETLICF